MKLGLGIQPPPGYGHGLGSYGRLTDAHHGDLAMISAAAAEALILNLVTPLGPDQAETIELTQADGRILAETVISSLDFPHWDNSAMDGYAVRSADVDQATPNSPVSLTVVEEIPAGKPPQIALQPGQAARILTGSMMPAGADAVVMQEVTTRQETQVTILESPSVGQFVRRRASYYRAGEPLLQAGTRLGAAEIAVLAATQTTQVSVYRRLRVAILSTGSELVTPQQALQPGQIVDSNQYALTALIRQAGGEAIPLGIVPDQPRALRTAIATALPQADLILSSGGVSVGDYDYVDQILTDLGATLHIRAVAIKPGKPLTVATLPGQTPTVPRLYFGLPGNPASALVSFWRFVQPAMDKWSGLATDWSPRWVPALTTQDLQAGGQRETYLWGHLKLAETGLSFQIAGGGHSSGNLINLAGTNALAVVPAGTKLIPQGSTVRVMAVGI